MDSINARVRELRKKLDITQAEFGERIGVKTAAVGNWEIGRQAVPDARIYQICKEFGVNRDWLEKGVGDMFLPQPTERDLLKEATLALFRRLDKEAQSVVLETLTKFRLEKSSGVSMENSPLIQGNKNVVIYGSKNGEK